MSLKTLGAEPLKALVKIGGVLAMVLGVVEAVKAVIALILAGSFGTLLSTLLGSYFPAAKWLADILLPLAYAYLVGALVAGVIVALAGYNLYRLGSLPSIPVEERNKWIVYTVILIALSLIVGATYIVIAFAVALLGLILLPAEQAPVTPPTPQGSSQQ